MTSEHFSEIFFTVMISTRSNKIKLAKYLNLSLITLNNYLTEGLSEHERFSIMDKLEIYLFDNLGGIKNDRTRVFH